MGEQVLDQVGEPGGVLDHAHRGEAVPEAVRVDPLLDAGDVEGAHDAPVVRHEGQAEGAVVDEDHRGAVGSGSTRAVHEGGPQVGVGEVGVVHDDEGGVGGLRIALAGLVAVHPRGLAGAHGLASAHGLDDGLAGAHDPAPVPRSGPQHVRLLARPSGHLLDGGVGEGVAS